MSYLSAFDVKSTAVATTTKTATAPAPPALTAPLLATKMTTYSKVKPTVTQTVAKPAVTVQPAQETTVTVTPQEVEVTSTEPAPSAPAVQAPAAAGEKKSWLPWALGAGVLWFFYKKK